MSSGPSSSASSVLPDLGRLDVEAHLRLQAVAHVVGLPRRQLVQGDLEMEAAGVRTGGLPVELAALDEHDVDAVSSEVVRERCPGEPSADDQDVGAVGQRSRELLRGQPAALGFERGRPRMRVSRQGEEPPVRDARIRDRRHRHGAHRRAWCPDRDIGDVSAVSLGDHRGDLALAVPALAEAHAGARKALDDIRVTRRLDRLTDVTARSPPRSGTRPSRAVASSYTPAPTACSGASARRNASLRRSRARMRRALVSRPHRR